MENDGQVIQTASSGGLRLRNSDGTIKVHCRICHRWVCDIDGRNSFFSCICAICEATDRGVVLPEEVEDSLRQVKMPGGAVLPAIVMTQEPAPDPMVGDKPAVGTINYWFRAIVQATAKKVLPKTNKFGDASSKELAKEKKRKPILATGFSININDDATHKE